MSWIRDVSQKQLSVSIDASLIKQKWYLQERANPDVKGLSKLQEDVASSMLSLLSESRENMIVISPRPPPLGTWGAPWDQLPKMHRQLVFFTDGNATMSQAAL